MYTPESIRNLIQILEARMQEWTTGGNYKLAITCGQALDALIEWVDKDFQGALPVKVREVAEMAELNLDEILEKSAVPAMETTMPVEKSSAVEKSASIPHANAKVEPSSDSVFGSGEVRDELDEIEKLVRAGDFPGAEVRLERLAQDGTVSDGDRSAIARVQAFFQARKRQAISDAEEAARAARREQPDNFGAQRAAWNQVQALVPDHREAAQALLRLDAQELSRGAYDELQKIQRSKRDISKEIGKIEETLRQVKDLQYDPDLQSPERQKEIEELLGELEGFRDTILRMSEGGASMERAGEYEKAIKKYTEAIRAGLTQIRDDITGEFIDPAERLRETTAKRDKDYVNRCAARYVDAERSMVEGAPEVAAGKLEEAQKLLEVVQTGGDEWRDKVNKLLEEARIQVQNKQRASEKVDKGNSETDPLQALSHYESAYDLYPSYPRLQERIRQKQDLLIADVLRNMLVRKSRIEILLDDRKYDDASNEAGQMMAEGGNLGFVLGNEEVKNQRQVAEALLTRIGEEKKHEQRFQERLESIQKVLEIPDVRLAKSFFESIPPQDKTRREVTELRVQIAQLGDDDQQWQDAQQAFGQGDFVGTIRLCEQVQKSPTFRQEAAALQRRAQLRVWDGEARQNRERSRWSEARAIYDKIRGLRGQVPSEDGDFLDRADEAYDSLKKQLDDVDRYEKKLEELEGFRYRSDWKRWREALQSLERSAGDLLRGDLAVERQTGIQSWLSDVTDKVERILSESQDESRWTRAFEEMHPLYMEGGIPDNDTRYQQVAYNAHSYEAKRMEGSDNPQYLDMQVDHLRKLLNVAPPPAIQESKRLVEAIRTRALRLAEITAAQRGGVEACRVLNAALQENDHELSQDVTIRGRMVRYALQDGDFDTARSVSQTIGFIDGRSDLARSWGQLVNAVEFFQSDDRKMWEKGAAGIQDARLLNSQDLIFQDSLSELASRMADKVLRQITLREQSVQESDILERVQLYAIVLKIRPGEPRAKASIESLAARIQDIGRNLNKSVLELNERRNLSPEGELVKLTELESQMSTLAGAFELLRDTDATMTTNLRSNLARVRERMDELRTYLSLIEELKTEYARAMSETWETTTLQAVYQAGEKAARQIRSVREFMEWQNKVSVLTDALEQLNDQVREVESKWTEDRFADVLTSCEQLESSLRQWQGTMKEQRLQIPEGLIQLHNPTTDSRLTNLNAVKNAARSKQQNLEEWDRWLRRFTELQRECKRLNEEINRQTSGALPCLSTTTGTIQTYIRQLTATIDHLQTRPHEARSKQAALFLERTERTELEEGLRSLIREQTDHLERVNGSIELLKKPIADLKRFIYGNINMQHASNQRTFRKLAEQIYTVDDCHPEWKMIKERYRILAGQEFNPNG